MAVYVARYRFEVAVGVPHHLTGSFLTKSCGSALDNRVVNLMGVRRITRSVLCFRFGRRKDRGPNDRCCCQYVYPRSVHIRNQPLRLEIIILDR